MFRFPWGDFHSLNLGWFLQKFNELREDWATAEAGIDGALDAEIQKAEDALTDVFAARDAAAASASAANSSALNASQSSLASMDARDQSRAARDAAQQASTNAAASETAAGNSATAASNSAGAAATSATQAGNSATAAGNSATAAGQSATNAAASETAAGNSAAAAAASETAAGNSASDAENAAASVEASSQQITTNANNIEDLKQGLNNMQAPITKEYTLIDAFVSVAGKIQQSTGSKTGLVKLKAGESIILGTRNDNISIISSTLEETIAVGDTVTSIYTTLRENRFGTVVYTATEDINIVFCYRAGEYTLAFANLIHDIIAPSLGDMQTPTSLQINDFRIVNNKLFRITAPIAAHTYLTPNTNCEEITVADILKTWLFNN